MSRKQFTITIGEDILNRYRRYCGKKDINMSKRIERYMKKDMKRGE